MNVLLKRRETDDSVGRLDGDAHLIPIIRSRQVEAVGSGPHDSAQYQPTSLAGSQAAMTGSARAELGTIRGLGVHSGAELGGVMNERDRAIKT